jgi:hypothetical protein
MIDKAAGLRFASEAKILAAKKIKTSLARRFAMIHLPPRHNNAKGGDPMSHGSAKRSGLLVREMKA